MKNISSVSMDVDSKKKIESYLMGLVRSIMDIRTAEYCVFAIAYVVVKADKAGITDLVSLPQFIEECKVSEDIALFLSDTIALSDVWYAVLKVKDELEVSMLEDFLLNCEPLSNSKLSDNTPTPKCVSELAIKILEIQSGDYVADYCSGRGGFIVDAIATQPNAEYCGYETSLYEKSLAMIRMDILGKRVEFKQEDVLQIDHDSKKYDKIFSNYPFAVKLLHNSAMRYLNSVLPNIKKSITADWAFHTGIIKTLKESGRAVAIATPSAMWNYSDRDIRRYFITSGYIEAVIALPEKLFLNTSIKTIIVVFSFGNDTIKFINAENLCKHGRRSNEITNSDIDRIVEMYKHGGDLCKEIDVVRVCENDYNLDPLRYFDDEIVIKNGVPFESVIKSITRGAQLRADDLDTLISDKPTKYQYLTLSDIQDGIISDNLSYLKSIDDNQIRYCLKNRDIILSKSGVPVKVAVAKVKDEHTVLANGNLYIVRVDEDMINPYFLKAFFESEKGSALLDKICIGTNIRSLSLDYLKKMLVPMPNMETQNQIANSYLATSDDIALLHLKLSRAKTRLKHIYSESEAD